MKIRQFLIHETEKSQLLRLWYGEVGTLQCIYLFGIETEDHNWEMVISSRLFSLVQDWVKARVFNEAVAVLKKIVNCNN